MNLLLRFIILISSLILIEGCVSDKLTGLPENPNTVVKAYGKVVGYQNDASYVYKKNKSNRVEGKNHYHHLDILLFGPKSHRVKRISLTLWQPIIGFSDQEFLDKIDELKVKNTHIKFDIPAGILRGKTERVYGQISLEDIEVIQLEMIPEVYR